MYTKWTSHLQEQEEKEKFQRAVRGSKPVLERLKDILNDQENELNRAETDPRNYEVPNWDYRQAHNNGYRQCLYILKKLIDLDQQETNNGRQSARPSAVSN